MGIAELFNSLFTSQNEKIVIDPLELECQLLRSRVTQLENTIKQAAQDRAVMESSLAINASQLEELQFRKQMDDPGKKSLELECPVLRLRVAQLEKKLGEEKKLQELCESALAIKPFELAAAETKLKELHDLGLREEDLDRSYEEIKMQEAKIIEKIQYLKKEIEEERTVFVGCKRSIFRNEY